MTIADTIADLERKHAESTPSPWSEEALGWVLRFADKNDGMWNETCRDTEWVPLQRDAAFIVAAHNGLPAILEYVRALEEVANVARRCVGPFGDGGALKRVLDKLEALRAKGAPEEKKT